MLTKLRFQALDFNAHIMSHGVRLELRSSTALSSETQMAKPSLPSALGTLPTESAVRGLSGGSFSSRKAWNSRSAAFFASRCRRLLPPSL